MCCTFTESTMSDTRLYVGEAEKNGKTVHVLAYQNSATTEGPNAMVIPFPTNVKMGQDNVIDTSRFKHFLKDITNASKMHAKSAGFGRRGMTLGADSLDFAEVFDVGSYTVVLADNVDQVPEALIRVPLSKRPRVTKEFLEGYGRLYPDQPIAVCCWNGAIEAEPLLWWYEPRDSSTLFVPTMDAHDGKAPRVGSVVYTDHIISVGSTMQPTGYAIHYSEVKKIPQDVLKLLPVRANGHKLPERLTNGDCFVKTAPLHQDTKMSLVHGSIPIELERGHDDVMEYSANVDYWM